MKLAEFYKGNTPVISFELFPPKTEKGMLLLEERIPKLIELDPSFMTVTYGERRSNGERRRHTGGARPDNRRGGVPRVRHDDSLRNL